MARLPDAEADFDRLEAQNPDRLLPIVWLRPIVGFPQDFREKEDTGEPVRLSLEDRLQTFQFIDSASKRDKAAITFVDDEGQFADANNLAHGAEIEVSWGYKGALAPKRDLVVKRLKLGMVQGRKWARRRRGFLVTVECLDRITKSHTRAPTVEDRFDNVTLSTVVRVVAERMGYHESKQGKDSLKISVPPEFDTLYESLTRPAAMTYPQFLSDLAERTNLMFKEGKDGLFFGSREDEAPTPYVIDMDGMNLMGFDLDGDLVLGAPAALTVESYSPKKKELKKITYHITDDARKKGLAVAVDADTANADPQGAPGEVEDPKPTLVQGSILVDGQGSASKATTLQNRVKEDYQASNFQKADEKALRSFFEKTKRTWKLRARLVGDPDIGAGKTVNLQNFETALLDGLWFIEEARHTIDNSGYITEITCTRRIPTAALKGNVTLGKVKYTPRNKKDAPFAESNQVESVIFVGSGLENTGTKRNKHGRGPKRSHITDGKFTDTEFDRK